MSRKIFSSVIITVNLLYIWWVQSRSPIDPGLMFLALITDVVISSVMQRWRFGRDTSWRARLDPASVIAGLIGLNLVLFALPSIRPH